MLTLLSWNVAGRVRRLPEQAERVVATGADVVCLQEVSRTTAPLWASALSDMGLAHVAVAPTDAAAADQRRRPLAVLTATRHPHEVVDVTGLPWPERVLSVRVQDPRQDQDPHDDHDPAHDYELVNVHSPISPSPGLAKVLTHEAVHAHLARAGGRRIVCGDLNTPRREHPDGRVWTFARDQWGRLRDDRGERWDEAELAIIRGLEAHGFRDAFRALHGPEARELSWEWPRWGGGYRLDHLVVSAEVKPLEVSYLHDWRREGLSDHSALWARLD